MANGNARRRFRINFSRAFGLGLVAVGALLLVLTYSAQLSIDDIGAQTTDPGLMQRVAMLEDQRNLFLVTSIGTLLMGFFAVAILGERSTPSSVPGTQMISAARLANGLAVGLSLAGNSSFLPARHGLTIEKMFIPAKGLGDLPGALSDDLVMSPGKDGSTPGVIVEPLGLKLLDHVETDLGLSLSGTGLEAAEGGLQMLKHGMGMMKDFHFKERDGKTVLRVEYSGLSEECRSIRKERPDVCRQVPCAGCSCLLTAMARATGKAVTISDVDNSHDTVIFTLESREW